MGIKGTLFGKPAKQTSESGNTATGAINSAFGPVMGYTGQAGGMLSNLLGMGGGPAQTAGLENFSNSGGMKFLMDQGTKAVTSSKAAQGLLNSGSYGTSLMKYGQGLGSTYLNQYMDNMFKLAQLGLGAGGLVSSTGAYSKGQSAGAKQGIAPMMIQAASMIPGISDRRLKSNIKLIGKTRDGLNLYLYDFADRRIEGVMADEVAKYKPEAYLPRFFGEYDGVDYSKLDMRKA